MGLLAAGLAAVAQVDIGATVPDIDLKLVGRDSTVSVAHVAGNHAFTVFVFLRVNDHAQCGRLEELAPKYQNMGVGFYAVYSRSSEKALEAHARKERTPFVVFFDKKGECEDAFGVTDPSSVCIVDPTRALRYRGKVDNGQTDPKQRRDYVQDALIALLSGARVEVTEGE